jgi:predicted phage tail protein
MDEPQRGFLPSEIVKKAGAIGLYQVAVWALAIVVGMVTLGLIVLALLGREAPAMLGSLGTTALVGLVAMLRGEQGG